MAYFRLGDEIGQRSFYGHSASRNKFLAGLGESVESYIGEARVNRGHANSRYSEIWKEIYSHGELRL